MAGFWDRLRGKAGPGEGGDGGPAADLLRGLLAGYPPNRPRHPGDAARLSDAERDGNLEQLIAERDERLAVVSDFLRDQGVDASPMLDPHADGVAAARAVDDWLTAVLPRRAMTPLGDAEPNPPVAAYRASDRSGSDIYYSLIADLALLEGEAIGVRDDRFGWAVNRLRAFRTMPSFGRICLIKPGSPGWDPTVLDLPEHLLAILHRRAAPGGDAGGHWYGELLDGAARRAFDP